jgi:CubicO group peptidase (beta-lactamase class C family)
VKGFILLLCPLFFLTACLGEKAPEDNLSKKLATDKSQVTDNNVWNEATPRSVGFDEEALANAFDYALADGTYTQAALVIQDNKLVYERYRGLEANELNSSKTLIALFNSLLGVSLVANLPDKNTQATSWSMAKSITSVLIGIAVEKKYIQSINDPVSDYLEEWKDNPDAKNEANSSQKSRSKITLRNLLNMRSGLKVVCLKDKALAYCDPSEPEAMSVDDNAIIFADNQGDKCLNRPLVENKEGEAGVSKFVYSNCDSLLLGMIIEKATGKDLERFAQTELFSKLGIRETYWWRDSSKIPVGGRNLAYCCLDATPRDFAKFGQLIVNNGVWDGKQIIPKWYIDEIKKSAKLVDDSGSYKKSYGLQFWSTFNKKDANSGFFYASGLGGQVVIMDFDNKMVVVRNSLYKPVLNQSDQRIMNVSVESGISFSANVPMDIAQINLDKIKDIGLPITLPLTVKSNFDFREFYRQVKESNQ